MSGQLLLLQDLCQEANSIISLILYGLVPCYSEVPVEGQYVCRNLGNIGNIASPGWQFAELGISCIIFIILSIVVGKISE